MNQCDLYHSQDTSYGLFCTFFFSLDEGSLPEQRTVSITGGPLTLLDDLTRLLSTSSSSNFFLFIDLGTLFTKLQIIIIYKK